MRWSSTLVLASFATAAPLVTQADNLSYSYVEVAYIGTDVDGRDDTFVAAA